MKGFHPHLQRENKEQLLKNEILEAEKEKLVGQVKEFKLKLDLKNLQYTNFEKKSQNSSDIPSLQPVKQENIQTIRMPNVPTSKRKGSFAQNEPTPKIIKR